MSKINGVNEAVENQIIEYAKECGLKKVVLFGSRARKDNRERSDIDLAVWGGNVIEFICGIDDEIDTLLMFDVVDMERPLSDEFRKEIEKDGVLLYEKV